MPPRTILPDARVNPRFAGLATFCRFPRIEDVAEENRPVDWAIYGVPFDGGVTYRPGARFGPRAIREASQYMKPAHPELGVNLAERFSMADAGDAPVRPFSCRETLDAAAEFAGTLGDAARTRLLAIGGDHSIAFANMRATWERRGKPRGGLALLHFDAHLDTVDSIWGERWNHGTVIRRAVEEGLIDPARTLSLGIRGPLNALSDLDFARERGVEIITMADFSRSEAESISRLAAFGQRIKAADVYLSFDIDCIDPAFAPGTGTPVCGGLTSAQAMRLVRSCAGLTIAGADIVEVLPDRDPAGITALLASHLIIEILALSAAAT